ncbi:matrix metalloproteinase-2-like isoform X1 [Macrobrachium nipponense]|uniref:matrix metalloproteinase-2-like isoform X1 n=1 Tax=Macrobrachium nipponense TaxID=159736 RepID=UPI0030C89BF8
MGLRTLLIIFFISILLLCESILSYGGDGVGVDDLFSPESCQVNESNETNWKGCSSKPEESFSVTPITPENSEKGTERLEEPRTKEQHPNGTSHPYPTVRFCGVERDNGEVAINSSSRLKRYIRQGSIWRKTNLKWTLRTPSLRPGLPSDVVRQQLIAAMNLWQQESTLVFEEVSPQSSNIDIFVDFRKGDHGDDNSFDGRGGTLAHAYYPGPGIGGDIHFDDAENFVSHEKVVEYVSTSLLVTAAHELGHSLGLSHSDVDKALMSPIYQTFPVNFNKLPDDDRRGIQSLYGRPEVPESTERYTFPPRTTPFLKTTTTTLKPVIPSSRPQPGTRPPPRPPKPHVPSTTTRRPPKPTRPPVIPEASCKSGQPRQGVPDMCNTDFDAVTVFRQEIFFFKGKHYWRISRKGRLYEQGAPHLIHKFFVGLPQEIDRVDAAYETKASNIVLISGTRYYELDGGLRLAKSDVLLSLGVNATRLNAAMTWGYNGRVYLFSYDSYWRLGYDYQAELDYPRDSGVWRRLPENYTGALTFRAKTYFFSGKMFWTFNASGMNLEDPLSIGPYWFGCPNRRVESRILCLTSSAPYNQWSSQLGLYHTLLVAVIYQLFQE